MVLAARRLLRFRSPLHDTRTAALLGVALGVAFSICFLTGVLSHLIQQPPSWFTWPTGPVWLYRVTQGLHVATGIAAVPLLLAKLWTVYPHFWRWPPADGVAAGLERLALLPLVGGALFMLASGVANIALWYPWGFGFRDAHWSMAWVTTGALAVHVGAKLHLTRQALADRQPLETHGGLSRRGFLGGVAAAAGMLTVATVGQTVRPLRAVSVLGPRDPAVGPQGVPVNKSATAARVREAIVDPAYRLVVDGAVERPLSLSLDDLRSLPQREAQLPITCVEGWSATGWWRGIPVGALVRMAGGSDGAEVDVVSLQRRSSFRRSHLDADRVRDPDTLLALELNGAPLHPDHGFPVRLIAPNRPGVLQTKWIERVVVR